MIQNALYHMSVRIDQLLKERAMLERLKGWRDVSKQVSHEIKNALTPLLLHVQQMILKTENEAERRKYINRFLKPIQKVLNLLETLAKERIEIVWKKVDVWHKINELINMQNVPDNIHVELKVLDNALYNELVIPVNVFDVALANVLRNAVEAIPPNKSDGRITVRVGLESIRGSNMLVISVEDNGVGMSKDELEKVFMPEFTTKSSGWGIGLSITKDLVDRVGGNISIASERGKGTEVTIKIPVKNLNRDCAS